MVAVAAGYHSLALTATGRVFSFGYGGLLGHGDEQDRHVPTAIAALAGERLGLDHRCLEEVLAIYRGRYKPAEAELHALYQRLMELVERSAVLADQLEVDGP